MFKYVFSKSFIFRFLLGFVFILFLGGSGLFFVYEDDFRRGQNFSFEDVDFSVILTDRNGIEIFRGFDQENREWASLGNLPETLKVATLIAEDRRFYSHMGVDPRAVIRAFSKNIEAGVIVQVASTLTQQIAKKVYLTDQRTYQRKFKELAISFGIESRYSKDEILEMYLNIVPYGPRSTGVEVASQVYFEKPASSLSDAESILLSVLPKNPLRVYRNRFISDWVVACPLEETSCNILNPSNSLSRIEQILLAVGESQGWSDEKIQLVWSELSMMEIPEPKNWVHSNYKHFQLFVYDFLQGKGFDLADISGGIIVQTSLDSVLQDELYTKIKQDFSGKLLEKHAIENLALLILDHNQKAPLVWIGSKDFWNKSISGQIDMLRSRRQTGSSMKPFIYSALIDAGFQPPTIFYDSRVHFRGDKQALGNSDGRYLGGIRMTEALAKSRNIPAAKALMLAGGESRVKPYLDKNFGFDILKNYPHHFFGWTLALGTAPVKLSNLANGYATLATGAREELCPILSIKTIQGELLDSPCLGETLATVDKNTAYFVSDMLSDIKARPQDWNWRSKLTLKSGNIAVKTGTSSKRVNGVLLPVDNIVVGYSPHATIFLWAGNASGKALNPGATSIMTIGTLWNDLSETFFASYPQMYTSFERPSGLQVVQGEWATLDYVPPSYDGLSRYVYKNAERGLNPLYSLGPISSSIKQKVVMESLPALPIDLQYQKVGLRIHRKYSSF